MQAWLKKIALDIMPSVAATIIGAYIVNYHIIPKSPAAFRSAIATDSKVADGKAVDRSGEKAATDKASFEKASFEKAVADKAEIEKTAEKAASDKATADKGSNTASIEPRKSAPKALVKSAGAAVAEPGLDDRRTTSARATDLARAAIERLRNTSHAEPAKAESVKPEFAGPELVKPEPARTPDGPRLQTVSALAVSPIQPLPPAISVVAPNVDVFEQGTAAQVTRQPLPQAASRADDPRRMSPPANIPDARPIDLRAEASSVSIVGRMTVADDVMSAAKSMLHAVIPR